MKYEIELVEKKSWLVNMHPAVEHRHMDSVTKPVSPSGNQLSELRRIAEETGDIEVTRDFEENRHSGKRRPGAFDGGIAPDTIFNKETIAYVAGSITGLVVFARHSIGIIKDWRDLTKGSRVSRKVLVKLEGKEIEISEGDDLLKILEDHWPDNEEVNKK